MNFPLLDTNTFEEETKRDVTFKPAEIVMNYLHFILDELPYLTGGAQQ